MKSLCAALLALLFAPLWSQSHSPAYHSLVNPFIGTGGHGHTFPGACAPFGMVQLSPDTRIDGSWDGCGGYHYSDSLLYGFSHTHLSGTGCSDYGDILIQPQIGSSEAMPAAQHPLAFSHQKESAQAGYYQVELENGVKVELTASAHVGFHRYQFPGPKGSLLLDLEHRDPTLECEWRIYDSVTLVGHRVSKAWADEQHVYFAMRLNRPLPLAKWAYDADNGISSNGSKQVLIRYKNWDGKPLELTLQVGLSSTSIEGAVANLKAESMGFDQARIAAARSWDQELGRIQARWNQKPGADTLFYSALYHTMIHPSLASDVDGKYRGRDQQIHQSSHSVYTVFSLWDTYRGLHPLLGLIDSTRTVDFIRSMLLQYQESGKLPVWELASCETNCMIGYHSVSVIADAYLKGIYGYDPYLALEAMQVSSNAKESDYEYLGYALGHLDVKKVAESVSKTLEYAYDDWCIARMAERLNQDSVAKVMYRRSERWQNLYNPQSSEVFGGFMQPRRNGLFEPFNPYEVNNHYTEANGWQYHFYVPHDVMGMMSAVGGNQAFEAQLDSLFNTRSQTDGREQSDITGLIGQYAHGNEPSHHMAYLYAYTQHPEKGQALVNQICQEFYRNSPDGLIGNEDCGQMSAWYVLSSLGLYPVCPGSNLWIVGSPQVNYALVNRGSLPPLTIRVAQEDQPKGPVWLAHPGVEASRDGQPGHRANGAFARSDAWLMVSHDNLLYTPTLVFRQETSEKALLMSPKQQFNTQFVPEPLVFVKRDSLKVQMPEGVQGRCRVEISGAEGKRSFYPDQTNSLNSDGSFALALKGSLTVALRLELAQKSGGLPGSTQQQQFAYSDWVVVRHQEPTQTYTLELKSEPKPMYRASGEQALVDGIEGVVEWRAGDWQGFYDQDLEGILDLLQRSKEPQQVTFRFLSDEKAWIFAPRSGDVEFSKNGKSWNTGTGWVRALAEGPDETPRIEEVSMDIPVGTRYLRFKVENYGALPPWHLGYHDQGRTYIFSDEIRISPKAVDE
ncbi:MAG: GH92 family glycosyl hydrolase [Bacteroidetes bacterium]|nr:GH92 family glycosyl hydrolase [Bacteroidota bacterium]